MPGASAVLFHLAVVTVVAPPTVAVVTSYVCSSNQVFVDVTDVEAYGTLRPEVTIPILTPALNLYILLKSFAVSVPAEDT